jgi:hypothetical protein
MPISKISFNSNLQARHSKAKLSLEASPSLSKRRNQDRLFRNIKAQRRSNKRPLKSKRLKLTVMKNPTMKMKKKKKFPIKKEKVMARMTNNKKRMAHNNTDQREITTEDSTAITLDMVGTKKVVKEEEEAEMAKEEAKEEATEEEVAEAATSKETPMLMRMDSWWLRKRLTNLNAEAEAVEAAEAAEAVVEATEEVAATEVEVTVVTIDLTPINSPEEVEVKWEQTKMLLTLPKIPNLTRNDDSLQVIWTSFS